MLNHLNCHVILSSQLKARTIDLKGHGRLTPHIPANLFTFCSLTGKKEIVKVHVNVDILGIIELKWTGMGEFHSDDHYIYYCGQESLRRNGVVIIVKKRVQNAVL